MAERLDYYDLVKIYRDYLIKRHNLTEGYANYEPKIFVNIIGNVNIKKHFLGIPYESQLSMTTYREAMEILGELAEVKKVVNYYGAINRGINQSLLSKIKFAKENGKPDEFGELKQYVQNQNDELFVNIDLLKVYTKQNGFKPKMGMYALDSKPLRMTQFNPTNKRFERTTSYYQILSPAYLLNLGVFEPTMMY